MVVLAAGVFKGSGAHGRAAAKFVAAQIPTRLLLKDKRMSSSNSSRQLKVQAPPPSCHRGC